MRLFCCLALAAAMVGLTGQSAPAQGPKDKAAEEAALVKNAESFIEAFHKGDAKALAAFWTEEGDYTDLSGRQLKGREAIERAFAAMFADNKGLKVSVESESLRFVTPDVAIEDGITSIFTADGTPPSRTRYTNVHVKKDGKWLLGSVRDAPYVAPTNYEHLRGLEAAIGEWAGESEGGAVEHLTLSWTENQNFVLGSFATKVKGITVGSATHWIGWDPINKKVRSWIFDAAGGFGEGTWARDGAKWTVKTASVLQDGKKATATYALSRVDADTLSLLATDRTVDGAAVPDAKAIKLKRVK